MVLYYFDGMVHLQVGIFAFILAMIGYIGSNVFYNAFLPEITTEDKFDSLSAKGFSMGYIGSVILLLVNGNDTKSCIFSYCHSTNGGEDQFYYGRHLVDGLCYYPTLLLARKLQIAVKKIQNC